MSADELLDLKIIRTGKEYRSVPCSLVKRWVWERRVTAEDLVRPVGSQRWMKVSLAPELVDEPPPVAPLAAPSATHPGPTAIPTAIPIAGSLAPTAASAARPALPVRPVLPVSGGGGDAAALKSPGGNPFGIVTPAKARRRRRKPPVEDTSLDMTPMIDVTFQLLIFFMLTNTMAHPTPIKVPVAEYGRGVSPDGMQTIVVNDQGEYFLGDSTRDEARAPDLDALVNEVAQNAGKVDQPLDVIISAHQQARHVTVRELMERLGTVANIGVIRIGVEEKR